MKKSQVILLTLLCLLIILVVFLNNHEKKQVIKDIDFSAFDLEPSGLLMPVTNIDVDLSNLGDGNSNKDGRLLDELKNSK